MSLKAKQVQFGYLLIIASGSAISNRMIPRLIKRLSGFLIAR